MAVMNYERSFVFIWMLPILIKMSLRFSKVVFMCPNYYALPSLSTNVA